MKTWHILFVFGLLLSCSFTVERDSYSLEKIHSRLPAAQENFNVIEPIRKPQELEVSFFEEESKRIKTARIVYVDYELVRRDFPQAAQMSNLEIDEWLLDNTAYMSSSQVAQENANDVIQTTQVAKKAYRPEDYGRALVFPIQSPGVVDQEPIGLIDAKGVGSRIPRAGDHSDGLMSLGEAIREFAYEKMVNRVFLHDDSGLKTVGSYAVIDGGYSVKHADGSKSPAGIILRQAHTRFKGPSSTMSDEITLKVEKTLRRYGITSAGAYRDKYPYDKLNVQGTKSGAVLDFGGFLVVENYSGRPAKHFFRNKVLLNDGAPNSIQPDPDLRVPFEVWGTSISGKEDPKLDNIWLWSHELAKNFSEGKASRDDAYNHLRNMWGPVFDRLERPGNQSIRAKGCHDLFIEVLGGFRN